MGDLKPSVGDQIAKRLDNPEIDPTPVRAAPDKRMFIGQSVESVDRGVVSTGLLFIARRPDSPYLVPGVDVEFVCSDIADRHKRERDKMMALLERFVEEQRRDFIKVGCRPEMSEEMVAKYRIAIAECQEGETQ